MKFKIFLLIVVSVSFIIGCKNDSVDLYNVPGLTNTYDSLSHFYNEGQISNFLLNNQKWPDSTFEKVNVKGSVIAQSGSCSKIQGNISVVISELELIDSLKFYLKRVVLSISGIPLREGKYVINEDGGCGMLGTNLFLSASDGDALVGTYSRLNSTESSITISTYNLLTGDVTGTFDISFENKFKSPGYFNNYPNILRINGGTFKTKWLLK